MLLETILGFLLFASVCMAEQRNFTFGAEIFEATHAEEKKYNYFQCYVDVVVYNSSSFKFGLENATVTALTGKLGDRLAKLNYSEARTDHIGHACVPVRCFEKVSVFVEKDDVRIKALNLTMQKMNIPPMFFVNTTYGNEVLQFFSYAWGTIGGRTGPVYSTNESTKCVFANTFNYHFTFSFITVFDRLVLNLPQPSDPNNPYDPNINNQWRNEQSCYFKIRVKTTSTEVEIEAKSRLNDSNGKIFGVFQTGPQYDVNAGNTDDKAACVEYRCPSIDKTDPDKELGTYVEGTIKVPGRENGCCVSKPNTGIFMVEPTKFRTKDRFLIGDNGGAEKGIYIHAKPAVARSKCFTGHEILDSEYAMDASLGFAFEYDCTHNATCQQPTQPIIGK